VPLLAEHDSFHRLLLRATAEDPEARFTTAAEMADQTTGVLREVLAAEDGTPRPALSTVFSTEREVFGGDPGNWPAPLTPTPVVAALPVPLVDPTDLAAGFLATTTISDPIRLSAALDGTGLSTVETVLALVRAKIDAGDLAGADADLAALEQTEDADWRITWYRGFAALAGGYPDHARTLFDTTYDLFPGEAAPKLALAATEELLGNPARAARLHELIWRTDHGYVSAAFGLARTRLWLGDRNGAVAAAESVPPSFSHHTAARLVAIRARLYGTNLAEQYPVAAGEALAMLELDAERQTRIGIDVLSAAHAWVSTNGNGTKMRRRRLASELPALAQCTSAGRGRPARRRGSRGAEHASARWSSQLRGHHDGLRPVRDDPPAPLAGAGHEQPPAVRSRQGPPRRPPSRGRRGGRVQRVGCGPGHQGRRHVRTRHRARRVSSRGCVPTARHGSMETPPPTTNSSSASARSSTACRLSWSGPIAQSRTAARARPAHCEVVTTWLAPARRA
jgi:hypothetical protein